MVVPAIVVIERSKNANEFFTYGLSHEVADVHDGSVVLTAEPTLGDTFLFSTNIPGVASGDFFAGTEVLPETVLQEGLAQAHFDIATISPDRH